MSLSELLKSLTPTERVITESGQVLKADDLLGKVVNAYIQNLPGNTKETSGFRASSIFFMCSREHIFQNFSPKRTKFVPRIKMMAEMGTDFHRRMQKFVLGPLGILKGFWYNDKGDKIEGYHPDPKNPQDWEYEEFSLYDPEYDLSGHIDGIISLDRVEFLHRNLKMFKVDYDLLLKESNSIPEGNLAIMDMKSVSQRNYSLSKGGDVPEYYKMQAELYCHLASKMKLFGQTYSEVYFLYTERENFSMFGKRYQMTGKPLADALRKISKIKEAINKKEMIDVYRRCNSPTDTYAQTCPHKNACFDPNLDFQKYVQISSNPIHKLLRSKGQQSDILSDTPETPPETRLENTLEVQPVAPENTSENTSQSN